MPEHEPVTVWRPKPELPPAPRLVSWWLQNLGTGSDGSSVEVVNVLDAEVGHVAVIAKLARGGHVWASTQHERDVARPAEAPVARIDVHEVAPENVAVPNSRHVQVVNRENRIRADYVHDSIVPIRRMSMAPAPLGDIAAVSCSRAPRPRLPASSELRGCAARGGRGCALSPGSGAAPQRSAASSGRAPAAARLRTGGA